MDDPIDINVIDRESMDEFTKRCRVTKGRAKVTHESMDFTLNSSGSSHELMDVTIDLFGSLHDILGLARDARVSQV